MIAHFAVPPETAVTRKRITVDLDVPLLEQVDRAAAAAAVSRSQFIASAVTRQLKQLERETVDREFEAMGRDLQYQELMVRMEKELAPASDELLSQVCEQELRDGVTYDAAR